MPEYKPVRVKVWGDWACFTRPEMKVERVSYEIMTPSAARGILEAIFWKPQFQWIVQRIHVLKPVRRQSLLRTEVNSKISLQKVQGWAKKDNSGAYYVNDDHTQRHTLGLRNVAYIIEADVRLRVKNADVHPAKYRDQFRRRVARGQCFHRPYLGCREFYAQFDEPNGNETAIPKTEDLGRMLFDINYEEASPNRSTPIFFQARLEDGVLHVPEDLYHETV